MSDFLLNIMVGLTAGRVQRLPDSVLGDILYYPNGQLSHTETSFLPLGESGADWAFNINHLHFLHPREYMNTITPELPFDYSTNKGIPCARSHFGRNTGEPLPSEERATQQLQGGLR